MPLAECQVQVRDLVMGPGTAYKVLPEFNPFVRRIQADQGGPRAWNHGSWSGAEWMDEAVVPVPVSVVASDRTLTSWLPLHQQLAAAFAPIGDDTTAVELRWRFGGVEYVLFGRPRLVEPRANSIAVGRAITPCAFVAQDPRIYSGELHTTTMGLPEQVGGLEIPGVVSSTPPYGLILSGDSGDYASTPDDPSLEISGDLVLTAEVRLDDYDPGVEQCLVAKYRTADDERSYMLLISSDGELRFNWSETGSSPGAMNASELVSTVAVNGEWITLRGWLNVDFEGTHHRVSFWTAPTPAGPWTQLGTLQEDTGTVGPLHDGPADVTVGAYNDGTSGIATGVIRSAQVWAGNLTGGELNTGETRAHARFDRQADDAPSFDDLAGRTWTINGDAEINGYVESDGLEVPFTIPGVLVGGRDQIVNAGTTDTGLVMRIDGPVVDPTVAVQRPDGDVQRIRFDLSLTTGQWLDIDTASRTALLNGLPQANQRGRAVWDIDPFPLPPGTSTIRFAAGDFNETAQLTVQHRDAWW